QLGQLQAIAPQLADLGHRIVAVSPDLPQHLAATREQHGLGFALLGDSDLTAARALGLAYQLDAATLAAYRDYGIDLEAASGRDHHALPVPAVLVLDPDAVLVFSHVNPDHTARLPTDVLLAMTKAALRMAAG
ncbi:MAG TPA: redoxin domain-containing protein, partial [Deferrisomatales bacterium]|nr:redoxin domain-containing protein [Deferrisomatales bacterium]